MSNLPSGTVTFLFTDIEGSTTLAQHYPGAWSSALARHDAILRAAATHHGGRVIRVIGDAFQVAFAAAPDAVAAATEAQQTLHLEPWGETGPIRVRMGLHTGAAEVRDAADTGPGDGATHGGAPDRSRWKQPPRTLPSPLLPAVRVEPALAIKSRDFH